MTKPATQSDQQTDQLNEDERWWLWIVSDDTEAQHARRSLSGAKADAAREIVQKIEHVRHLCKKFEDIPPEQSQLTAEQITQYLRDAESELAEAESVLAAAQHRHNRALATANRWRERKRALDAGFPNQNTEEKHIRSRIQTVTGAGGFARIIAAATRDVRERAGLLNPEENTA